MRTLTIVLLETKKSEVESGRRVNISVDAASARSIRLRNPEHRRPKTHGRGSVLPKGQQEMIIMLAVSLANRRLCTRTWSGSRVEKKSGRSVSLASFLGQA